MNHVMNYLATAETTLCRAATKHWATELREQAERLYPDNGILQSRWMICVMRDRFNVRDGGKPCLLMHGAPAQWKGYA